MAFLIRDDGTVTVEAENVDLQTLRGMLKPTTTGVTLDDMNAAIRSGAAKR